MVMALTGRFLDPWTEVSICLTLMRLYMDGATFLAGMGNGVNVVRIGCPEPRAGWGRIRVFRRVRVSTAQCSCCGEHPSIGSITNDSKTSPTNHLFTRCEAKRHGSAYVRA